MENSAKHLQSLHGDTGRENISGQSRRLGEEVPTEHLAKHLQSLLYSTLLLIGATAVPGTQYQNPSLPSHHGIVANCCTATVHSVKAPRWSISRYTANGQPRGRTEGGVSACYTATIHSVEAPRGSIKSKSADGHPRGLTEGGV